jgi:hypothetical protein
MAVQAQAVTEQPDLLIQDQAVVAQVQEQVQAA